MSVDGRPIPPFRQASAPVPGDVIQVDGSGLYGAGPGQPSVGRLGVSNDLADFDAPGMFASINGVRVERVAPIASSVRVDVFTGHSPNWGPWIERKSTSLSSGPFRRVVTVYTFDSWPFHRRYEG